MYNLYVIVEEHCAHLVQRSSKGIFLDLFALSIQYWLSLCVFECLLLFVIVCKLLYCWPSYCSSGTKTTKHSITT